MVILLREWLTEWSNLHSILPNFVFLADLGNRFRLVDLEEVEPLRKLVRQTLVPALALEV